jgi:cytoskeletal protein CcmA (bactofilin family)
MAMDPERTNSACTSRVARISGRVEFRGLAKIEGDAEGEITGDDIEIEPSAVVTGQITANSLKVAGHVDGEIVARERVEVLSTARLRCTITTPTLVVAEGARFEGDCKMPRRPTNSRQPESGEAKKTEVPLFITQTQREALREPNYSENDIAN